MLKSNVPLKSDEAFWSCKKYHSHNGWKKWKVNNEKLAGNESEWQKEVMMYYWIANAISIMDALKQKIELETMLSKIIMSTLPIVATLKAKSGMHSSNISFYLTLYRYYFYLIYLKMHFHSMMKFQVSNWRQGQKVTSKAEQIYIYIYIYIMLITCLTIFYLFGKS